MSQKLRFPLVFRAGMLTASMGLTGLVMGLVLLSSLVPVQAAPAAQIPIYTPTPGADGRIIYIVKANDTLLGISLIMGVPVDKLRAINNLTADTIYEGQKLLLGLSGPAEVTPTPGPTPTPTPILPTPSPRPGEGKLCLLLFNDVNGDSIRQEDEPSIPDGAISFGNRSGSVSQTVTTGMGLEPQCFENLPEGDYTVSAAVPKQYNSTTVTNYDLELEGGAEAYLNFGAQVNSQAPDTDQPPPQKRSPWLALVGVFFLLAGVAVAVYASYILKNR